MIVGPQIIRDGLILHVDAGSERCYVSGSTTGSNLVTGGSLTGASGQPDAGAHTPNPANWPDWLADNGGVFDWDGTHGINVEEDLGSTTACTHCYWINKTSIVSSDYLADGRNDGGTYWLTNYLDANISIGNAIRYLYEEPYNATSTLFVNRWQFLVITSDGTARKIYIDGIDVEESTVYNNAISRSDAISETFGVNFRIGTRYSTTGGWDGQMGNLMFYNRVLTAEEIRQNYNATCRRYGLKPVRNLPPSDLPPSSYDPILNGVIAAYEFEDTDSTFTSQTGSSYANGLSTATVSTGSFSGAGNSLFYDISSNAVSSVSHSAEFEMTASNALTLMVDIYPTANGGSATSNIAGFFIAESGNHVYNLGYNSANQIRGRVYDTVNRDKITTATCPLNEWRRVMLRYESGSVVQVKISGSVEESGSITVGAIADGGTPELGFHISMPPYFSGYLNRQFEGRVDNVIVWNRKLSDAEMDQMMGGDLPTFSDLKG